MKEKPIKLIMELIFIFILPLLILCISIDIKKDYTLDENGNITEEIKTLDYNNVLLQDTLNPMYTNYLNFNQLINNGNFIDTNYWNKNYSNTLFNVNNNVATINAGSINGGIFQRFTQVINHKYVLIISIQLSNPNTRLRILNNDSWDLNYIFQPNDTIKNDLVIFYTNYTSNNSNGLEIRDISTTLYDFYLSNIMCIDLTQMFGSGYEPTTKEELNNYVDLTNYHEKTESEIINYEYNNIISENYKINYTPIGAIKQLIEDNLHINDNLTTTIVFDYTILWFIMFIIWHFFYLFFDGLVHLFIDWKKRSD